MSCVGCGLPQDPGNCGFNASSEVRYFFNATSGQCQQFEYAEGCSGNGNNFETMQECQDTCRELARTVTSWCSLSSVHPFINLSINPSIHPSIHQPNHPSIYVSIHQRTLYSMCPFMHPYLSKHPCMQAHTYTSPPSYPSHPSGCVLYCRLCAAQ